MGGNRSVWEAKVSKILFLEEFGFDRLEIFPIF